MFKESPWRTGIWYPQRTTAKPRASEELPVSGSIWYCRVAEENVVTLKWRWHQVWPWGWSQEWLRKVGSWEDPTTVSITHWSMASGFWLRPTIKYLVLETDYRCSINMDPLSSVGNCRSWVYSCGWWHLCSKSSAPSSKSLHNLSSWYKPTYNHKVIVMCLHYTPLARILESWSISWGWELKLLTE